jgi:type II secretion system protein C
VDLASLQATLIPNPRTLARNAGIIAIASLLLSFVASIVARGFLALPTGVSLLEPTVLATSGSETSPSSRADVTSSSSTRTPRKLPKRSYIDPILTRNIFDSSAVGSTASDEPSGEGRRTDLRANLLATVVADPQEYSSCLIAAGEGSDARVEGFGIGDKLLSDATILQILQKRVILRRSDGSIEYLAMGDETGRKEETGKTASTEGGEGIEKAGENKFTVEESVLKDALANVEALASQLRASPHRGPDGEVDGFRLSSIRRGSLLQKLGIKNGDIVHSVNGTPLVDTNSAMGAYQALQNERSFSFEVTRRNQKQTFEYTVR